MSKIMTPHDGAIPGPGPSVSASADLPPLPGTSVAAAAHASKAAAPSAWAQLLALFARSVQRALQWRLLLLWIVITVIPTLLLALPVWRALARQLDNFLHANEWSNQWNVVMMADLLGQLRGANEALAGAGIAAGLALFALIPLANGMFVAAARAPGTPGFGELLHGGLRYYGPMLRTMFLALVPLGIALGLGMLMMKGVGRYGEHAILESDVDRLRWPVLTLAGLLFAWANASVDAGRAYLALAPSRRSAIRAWWRGLKLVLRYPLRSLGLYLGVSVLAAVGLAVAGWLRLEIPSAGQAGFLVGLLLTQLIVAITGWMHFARQFAMLELARVVQAPS
jgi:hypothetical protein